VRTGRRPASAMAALAAIVMALVAAAPVQAAEPGGISGRITSNGATVDLGMVDVYDWYTLDYVTTGYADVTGKYEITGLEPGVYEVALGNGDGLMWYDYFPELYNDVPYHLDYRAEPVEVTGGGVTGGIDADLQPMFGDMFDTPFTEDIAWMQYTGLTRGCGGDLYCTDTAITRDEMAAFLVRAFGYADGGDAGFTDVGSSVFEIEIDRLAAAGITKGCNPDEGNTRFCPQQPVTRGQMAAFLVRALGYADQGDADFDDDNGSVFEADIARLATAGVTFGCNPPANDSYCPNETVTRGQMAAFLHRALGDVLYPASTEIGPIRIAATTD